MRKLLLLTAAFPLVLVQPAFGHDRSEPESSCPPPEVTHQYDTEALAVHVKLPASGCRTREHTQFMLSASISRLDHEGGRDVVERSAMCGPFRSADDFEDDQEPPQYSCTLALWLDHPDVETAQYDVEVTYPGSAAERTRRLFTFCTSDGTTASCEA